MVKQASKWFVFWLVAIAQFMVVLDVSIVNVALEQIQRSLGFSQSQLQWIVTIYALMFGGLLLLGGRLADLFGRRRMLLVGLGGFVFFSLITGLSTSPLMMIIARGLQGLSAALMSPAALSSALTLFPAGGERNKALGFWSLVSTAGGAVGLLLGGALTQYIGWRWDFFINVPVGALLFTGLLVYGGMLAAKQERRKLDIPGAILATGGLMALVLGISQAPEWGWLSPAVIGLLVGSVVLLGLFVRNEARHGQPLVPLSIFKNRNVTGANLMIMPFFATNFSMFFLLSLYVQNVLGYTPLQTGLAFLPFPIIVGILSTQVSKRIGRIGFRRFLLIGPWFVILGLLWLARLPADGSYWPDVLPALILLPIGMGLSVSPILSAATSSTKPEDSGLASGLVNTSQQVGGALGLSILTGLSTSVATANAASGQLPAMVRGYEAAFVAAIGFSALGIVVAITMIRDHQRPQRPDADVPEKYRPTPAYASTEPAA